MQQSNPGKVVINNGTSWKDTDGNNISTHGGGIDLTGTLFDLKKDPYELENVIDSPEYAGIKDELLKRLMEWDMETA